MGNCYSVGRESSQLKSNKGDNFLDSALNDESAEEIQDSDSSVVSESALKAMRIIEILEVIVKYLPFKQLLKLRLLSKTWNDAIIPQLRKQHATIYFSNLNSYNSNSSIGNLVDFLKVSSESLTIPFTKYHMESTISFDNTNMAGFLNTCGYFITELGITIPQRHQQKQFLPTLSKLVHLAKLELTSPTRGDSIHDGENHTSGNLCPNSDLCNNASHLHFPKLKKIITYFYINEFLLETQTCLMQLLNASHCLQHLEAPHLTTIYIFINNTSILSQYNVLSNIWLTKSHLKLLLDLSKHHGLTLKELNVTKLSRRTFSRQRIVEQFQEFLLLQSTSLSSLRISIAKPPPIPLVPINIELPTMSCLKKLELDLRSNINFSFHSFRQNFPMLQELRVNHCYHGGTICINHHNDQNPNTTNKAHQQNEMLLLDGNNWISHIKVLVPSSSLQILSIEYDGIHSSSQIEQLAELFPNLIKFEISLDSLKVSNLMTTIWRSWPGLRSLRITDSRRLRKSFLGSKNVTNNTYCRYSDVLDEIVTGIPKEAHGTLKKWINNNNKCIINESSVEDILRKWKNQPGISDMKELREFKISGRGILTDISGYFGFCIPKTKLKKLEICNRNNISTECFNTILKNMGINSDVKIAKCVIQWLIED